MKTKPLIVSILLTVFSFSCFTTFAQIGKHWLSVPIDKGVVKGDYTIQFVELNNVALKPNESFSLSALGIAETSLGDFSPGYYNDRGLSTYKKKLKSLGKNEFYCFYKVQITRPNDANVYYGIMCFYGVPKKREKSEAVAESYEIKIPDAHFNNCKGGNIANAYEYWNKSGQEVPTWILLFSDSKDLMWK